MNRRSAQRQSEDATSDDAPLDMDAFRNDLTRRIYKLISLETGCWRGCRERICRRKRHCMAPNYFCANAKSDAPEPTQEAVQKTVAGFRRAIEARRAELAKEGE